MEHRLALGAQTRPWAATSRHPPSSALTSPPPLRLCRKPLLRSTPITSATISNNPQKEVKRVTPPSPKWRSFWATVDTSAWLGTVGTALAFLLTQEALLVSGPILLPLIALYASRQRGKLDSQAAQAALQAQVAVALYQVAAMSEESAADVAEEVAALVDEVRQGRTFPDKAVRSVEAKLAAVEGGVRSIEAATKEALVDAAAQRGRAVKEISSAMVILRRDLNNDLRQATGDELAALGRMDSRLAALEGAISGLEVAQSDGLRRLGASMKGALNDGTDALTAAVRDEVWQSLEPVRQLPQMLAAATPVMPVDKGMSPEDVESLRALVAEEIAAAGRQLLEQQRALLQQAATTPTTIAPPQWNQLGKRLVALDTQIAALKTEQGRNLSRMAEDGFTATTAAAEQVSQQVNSVRSELAELAQSVTIALEQQQTAQAEAFATLMERPTTSAAPQLEALLLKPLEMALLQLQSELRAAAVAVESTTPNADGEEPSPESKLIIDLQNRFEKLFASVLDSIAAARQSAAATATVPADGSLSVSEEQQAVFNQAAPSNFIYSKEIEALMDRLASVEEIIGADVASGESSSSNSSVVGVVEFGENSVLKSSSLSVTSPPPQTGTDDDDDDDDDDVSSRASAYERMQALLRSANDTQNSNGNGGDDDGDGSASPGETTAAAEGVPISDWLFGGNASDDANDDGGDAIDSGVVEQQREKREIMDENVVTIGAPAAAVNSATQSGGGGQRRVNLMQDQIAFEAALGAAVDLDEMEGDQKEDIISLIEKESALQSVDDGDEERERSTSGFIQAQFYEEQELEKIEEIARESPSSSSIAKEEEDDGGSRSFSKEEEEEELVQEDPEVLYSQGLELLRQGRFLATESSQIPTESSNDADADDAINDRWNGLLEAEAMLRDAAACFTAVSNAIVNQNYSSSIAVKALGNTGNALMAQARVKRQLAQILSGEDERNTATAPESVQRGDTTAMWNEVERLLAEAKELLVVAGRKYREVLQSDDSQGRAFLNWGRAVCLRAEMAREAGQKVAAVSLFCNAAEKFQAALELDAEPGEGSRLAGTALLGAAECIAPGSGGTEEEEDERRDLLEEAEGYLVAAVEAGSGEETFLKLEKCRRLLGWD